MLLAFADGGPLRGGIPPLPATGLKLQLESDTGVSTSGGLTTSWADLLSGSGIVVSQATGANQPAFNASGFSGQPSITFTTTKWLAETSSYIVPVGSDRSVIVVAKSTNTGTGTTTGGALACFGNLAAIWLATLTNQPGDGNTYVYSSASGAIATRSTQFSFTSSPFLYEQYGTVSPTPGLTVNINRVAQSLNGAGNVISENSGHPGFTVGNINLGTAGFIGDIAAVYVYDHILTGPEIGQVRARTLAKYGV